MALVFCDGFDHYNDETTAMTKWSERIASGGNFPTFSYQYVTTPIRGTTGRALYLSGGAFSSVTNHYITKIFPTTYSTFIMGFAVYPYTANVGFWMVYIYDVNGNIYARFLLNSNYQPVLELTSASPLQTITGAGTAQPNQYSYVEIKLTPQTSGGFAELRLNGVSQGTFTGNTLGTAQPSGIKKMLLGFVAANATVTYDDVYCCDGTGAYNNDFLGDVRVAALYPNAAGAFTQLNRGGSAPTNWQSVNEVLHDSDTTYVGHNTAGKVDTYNYQDLPSSASSVKAVASSYVVRKDDVGTRTATTHMRSSSGEADLAQYSPGLTYAVIQQTMDINPVTLQPWTVNDVNNGEFGLKVVG